MAEYAAINDPSAEFPPDQKLVGANARAIAALKRAVKVIDLRRGSRLFVTVLFAATLALQPVTTSSTEMLTIDAPKEFEAGNHQRNNQNEITELVVPPETVDSWSRLITNLAIFNGTKIGLDNFYAHWRDRMHFACPGLTDTLVRGMVDGHPAVSGILSCPQNPQTGKPENLTAFFVEGDTNLMSAQVAFRRAVSPTDTALIERIAHSLKVCDQSTFQACSVRKASGFVPDR